MINFDFDYYRPSQLDEAYRLYKTMTSEGKKVLYYSGGTEIVTLFRKNTISADAVIDLKNIEGIKTLDSIGNVYGACVSLNDISESNPLFARVFNKIADHTARNTITLGGNICGRLPYREAVLPLLALNASLLIYNGSLQEINIRDIFDKRLRLDPGAILYQIKVNADLNYVTERMTESTAIDYPLLHLLVSNPKEGCFVALSGYSAGPIYKQFESCDESLIISHFVSLARDSIKGSSTYKIALLEDGIHKALRNLEVTHD